MMGKLHANVGMGRENNWADSGVGIFGTGQTVGAGIIGNGNTTSTAG